ncbi:GyrI-like domain-containing protein [Solitalea lacus]|uniref:GyrI-like domain-containing protein n=1 Tax=Solitalea lacus TaxID=2911172 RepID=UPI001EDAF1F5|nr:GyrI-like domain-containing protein [Solitalea lacus]UKJ09096.1 GyrI-like domain-containing protein [Solitalea lacus]
MKIDLTKQFKSYYSAKLKPELIEIEPAQFLSIEGIGDPSGKTFSDNIQTLYAVAYAIKFGWKARNKDFTVAKLEGLWWFDEQKFGSYGLADAPMKVSRDEWNYRMLIRLPDFVTQADVHEAIETVILKKNLFLAKNCSLFRMHEGAVVQLLHVGPFAEEPGSLLQIQEFINQNNLKRNGVHHEIYLSDFRKVSSDKLKTILREPVI